MVFLKTIFKYTFWEIKLNLKAKIKNNLTNSIEKCFLSIDNYQISKKSTLNVENFSPKTLTKRISSFNKAKTQTLLHKFELYGNLH